MAQNITLMGASYSDVPAVTLPKTGGGTATFTDVSDTTAAASDVASGKYFYTSAGVKTQGTSSGGGGSSNVVIGTFTTPSTGGSSTDVTVSYTGSGYALAMMVYVDGGTYTTINENSKNWYDSVQRYAIGLWCMSKGSEASAPNYGGNSNANQATVITHYKNSTTNANSYSRAGSQNAQAFTNTNATASSTQSVRIRSATKFSYFTASTSYGLLPSTKYKYIIIYSS